MDEINVQDVQPVQILSHSDIGKVGAASVPDPTVPVLKPVVLY
jgi:hypothetical protein